MMLEKLKTVIPALVTPLKKDGSFDAEGMKRLVEYVQSKGMDHLFVLGYAGECLAFDRETRKQVISTVRKCAKPGTILIAGVMDDSTKLILTHIQDAYESGADIVLSTPTNFLPLKPNELKNLFIQLADKSPLPIMIYNCPENQHYIEPDAINELAKHPNIIALKETSNTEKVQRMMLGVDKKNEFLILSGNEFVFLSSLSLGVEAYIMGGPGNMLPAECLEIMKQYQAGEVDQARDGYLKMTEFLYEFYEALPYPTAVPQIKAALELWGICERWMAQPMDSVSDEDMPKVQAIMDKYDIVK